MTVNTLPPLAAELSDAFLARLDGRLGAFARPNLTAHAVEVTALALKRIRVDLSQGGSLTEKGEVFVREAAGYFASLLFENWRRRDAIVEVDIAPAVGRLALEIRRTRDGVDEFWRQDMLGDFQKVLVDVPGMIGWLKSDVYVVESLVLPSPDYLLFYGMSLLWSQHGEGNWPDGQEIGGLPEDFDTSRSILVDDLHTDCGLPVDDAALRKLSWWVVFPPFGYRQNEGQAYNLMTLMEQIFVRRVVSPSDAAEYLRGLLRCQTLHIRNLAARALMVCGEVPQTPEETRHFMQSMQCSDWPRAANTMVSHRWIRQHLDVPPDQRPRIDPTWAQHQVDAWMRQPEAGPHEKWTLAPSVHDPDYLKLAELAARDLKEAKALGEALLARHIDDWHVRMSLGGILMGLGDTAAGEPMLRRCVDDPQGPNAHIVLCTWLARTGRDDEALAVSLDAVRRYPYFAQAVDQGLWRVTDGMTQAGDRQQSGFRIRS
jgi:hypothetical protein